MNIYLVIAWHLLVSAGLLMAALHRHRSSDWAMMQDVALKYDVVYGSLTIILLASCVGLHFKKAWGYHIALSANSTLFLLPLGIAIFTLIMYPEISVFNFLRSIHTLLIVGLGSFLVFVWLLNPKVKRQYVPSNI